MKYFSNRDNSDALLLVGSLFVIALLLVPYASNGFWFDDALNSLVYFDLQRLHGSLAEFSYHVMKHWLVHEGRLMLGFLYGYSAYYVFHDLVVLRIAQCVTVIINLALYGYLLYLLGATVRFLVVWAVLLVGLFQISTGMDAVAGFAFHYQILGIQLTIALILFTKWQQNNKNIYLYSALLWWIVVMFVYEVNSIFIPIAFAFMFVKGNQYRKFPGLLLIAAAGLYLAIHFYIKAHAGGGSYAGSALGLPSKMGLAYLMQLTATFPLLAYSAVTHKIIPFNTLVEEATSSTLAWVVLFSSLIFFVKSIPIKSSALNLKTEAFVLSLGMFLLPAIFPAISLRYQNEVGWGAGTLPVYYQCFGLAFFAACAFSFIPKTGWVKFGVPIILSVYLAVNVTINFGMVNNIDKGWREPRDAFAAQAQSGLFEEVHDGDIIFVRDVAHFVNEALIFEWSGKNVFIPAGDHFWFPQSPSKSAKRYELSRSQTGEHRYQLIEMPIAAEYRFIPSLMNLTKALDSFPANLPMIEVQIEYSESKHLDAVDILAPNGLGNWTTYPVNNTWGIGVINKGDGEVIQVLNKGVRVDKMNLPVAHKFALWFPDNGNLANCPEIQVKFTFDDGKSVAALAACKHP